MKKSILIALALVLALAACNRKSFVKKLVGTYKIEKYLFDGLNQTYNFDTTYREWQLQLSEDERYSKTWKTYSYRTDTLYLSDTLGFDSVNLVFLVNVDTVEVIDTTITPHLETGKWDLLNSEEDLQLRNDTTLVADIYRILELKSSNLTLRKGNEEIYLKK